MDSQIPTRHKPEHYPLYLLTAGLGSLILYVLLARLYPLVPSLDQPRASWVSLLDGDWYRAGLHFAIYLGVTIFYIWALRLLTSKRRTGVGETDQIKAANRWVYVLIVLVWLACSLVLMTAAPAGDSHDIFDYLFRGRMMVEYGANPLVDIPIDYIKEPYFKYLAWTRNIDSYGPLWEIASAGVARVVRELAQLIGWWTAEPSCPKTPESCRLLVVYLSGYRLLAVSLVGLSGLLVVSLVKRDRPQLAPAALAAWLWSPMTLVSTALGGHNDILMLFLFLLCLWLLARSRLILALVALILAVHVKMIALIWLPAMGLWIISRWGWRRALQVGLVSLLAGVGLSWSLYAPFDGWGSLPQMVEERTIFLTNSIWRVINRLFYTVWRWPKDLVWRLTVDLPSYLLVILAVVVPMWQFNFRPKRWRMSASTQPDNQRLLWGTLTTISLLALLVGSFWFQSWYVIWALTPAVLLPDSRFTRSLLPWLVFGALSANLAQSLLRFPEPNPLSLIGIDLITALIIWLPMLVAVLFHALKARRTSET